MNGTKIPLTHAPLAERLRPQTFDEVIGQEQVLGAGTALLLALGAFGCGDHEDFTHVLNKGGKGVVSPLNADS